MDNCKYVVVDLDGKEIGFTFPRFVDHDRFVECIESIRFGGMHTWERKLMVQSRKAKEQDFPFVVGAGFVSNGKCHGRSETLDVDSRGDLDTKVIMNGLTELK